VTTDTTTDAVTTDMTTDAATTDTTTGAATTGMTAGAATTVVLPAMIAGPPGTRPVETTGDPAGGKSVDAQINIIITIHITSLNTSMVAFEAMYLAHLSRSNASHRALSLLGPPKS